MTREKKFYMYWMQGQPKPADTPQGCEYCDCYRRWEVPEHIYRAHMFCEAYGIQTPEGYEVIGFREADPGEICLDLLVNLTGSFIKRPILRKIEPVVQYREPTLEDAKACVIVEVCDQRSSEWCDECSSEWLPMRLVAIDPLNRCYPFRCASLDGTKNEGFKHARIKVEEA